MTYQQARGALEYPADLSSLCAPVEEGNHLKGTRAVEFQAFNDAMQTVDARGQWLAECEPKLLLHNGAGNVCGTIDGPGGLALAQAAHRRRDRELLDTALFVSLVSVCRNSG